MSKPSKYDQAVAKSRGETVETTSLATIGEERLAAAVQTLDPAMLAAMVASGEIEAAPQIMKIEIGQMITGLIASQGEAEIEDSNTRTPKIVKTWQIELVDPTTREPNGITVSILGSAQLDRQLPKWLGTPRVAVIARGQDTTIKGGARRMAQYFVGAYR